jgi:small subunit ribosomal protein S18
MKEREPRDMRKKVCKLCVDRVPFVSYRDEKRLARAISDRGKIVPRRISGNCARHQSQITLAVKRARYLALLPFASESYR